MSLGELAKQLQALVAGVLPFAMSKLESVLPFLNPQITDEMWPMTSVLSVISSGVMYNLAQRFQKPSVARRLCLWGLGAAIVSFIGLVAVVIGQFLSHAPVWEDLVARGLFVILFVSVGLVVGWCFAHVL
jgi:uncharacterized membrane protein